MKTQTKHILAAAGIAVAVYVVYEIWKAFKAGITDIGDLIAAPFTALSGAVSSVTSTVQNVSAGNAAAAQITTMNNSDYAPGGSIYNQIAATQGTAAANQAWQTVQANQAAQQAQTVTLDPLTWF